MALSRSLNRPAEVDAVWSPAPSAGLLGLAILLSPLLFIAVIVFVGLDGTDASGGTEG